MREGEDASGHGSGRPDESAPESRRSRTDRTGLSTDRTGPSTDRTGPSAGRTGVTRRGLLGAAGVVVGRGVVGRGVGVAAAEHDEVLFEDGFERSTTGVPPRDWAGDRTGVVVGSLTAPEGTNVLRMGTRAGTCRPAAAAHDVGRLPESGVVTVSGFVRPEAGGGCRDHRATVRLLPADPVAAADAPVTADGPGRLLVGFPTDGTVMGAGGTHWGTYRLEDWNAFTVAFGDDGSGLRLGYTVNGDWRGTVARPALDRYPGAAHLRLGASGTVSWDAVSVVHRRTRGVDVPAATQVAALSAYREAVLALGRAWDPERTHAGGAAPARRALVDLFGPGMPDFALPAGVSSGDDLVERTGSAFRTLRDADVPAAREAVRDRWRAGATEATRRSYEALGVAASEATAHPFDSLFGVLDADVERVVERRTPAARATLATHAATVDALLRTGLARLREGSYPPGGDALVFVLRMLEGVARTLEAVATA